MNTSFNVIEDDNYYYFFRALNIGDLNDIDNNITISNGQLTRIRTDRDRYNGNAKYSSNDFLSLEEIYDHIKMHHRKDTNCISLTSNASVALNYGRSFYKDRYAIIKIPKNTPDNKVVNAGKFMLDEINNRIKSLVNNNEISDIEKYFIDSIDNASNQEELNRIIENLNRINKEYADDIFEGGIDFSFNKTNSIDFNALNDSENFEKNKVILKLDIIKKPIIPNVANKFLIQTVGNAFSSLEYIHYNDIPNENIMLVDKKIIDVFSLIQQIPNDFINIENIKKDIIRNIGNENYNSFKFSNYSLNTEDTYTIENMYNSTGGQVDFYTSINLYKKSFYLAKSKLRVLDTVEFIKRLTNNKYPEIYDYLEQKAYGIEPEIISRKSNKKNIISESISLDVNSKDSEIINFINNTNQEVYEFILNNPDRSFDYYLNNFKKLQKTNYTKKEYYANAIIDLFDWEKLGVLAISPKQRKEIVDKLISDNVVSLYDLLKNNGVKETQIANTLLTIVIKEKDYSTININDTFTIEELEDYLGYYEIKETQGLKLRSYQASALKNINKIFKEHNFTSVVLPTGAGKSFVSLAKMIENKNSTMLYIAPNDVILEQIKDYVIDYLHGTKETFIKNKNQIIKEIFPNLTLCTYSSLLSENQDKIINKEYNLIILDELHRSGASEWKRKVLKLFESQRKNTKILGITATPERDVDQDNMADEWARYFGYSDEEIESHEHVAINMDIEEAIKLGYVVNPKIVFCEYNLFSKDGALYNLQEKINLIENEDIRNKEIEKFKQLRKIVEKSDNISKTIGDNIKKGGRYIVFLPAINKDNKVIENEDGYLEDTRIYGTDVIEKYKKLLIDYLKEYYNLPEDEIKKMIEFHSMLGQYGTSKNQKELEYFENKNENKIKFMLVLNKLNEGSHAKNDGLIWFRPIDENSNILRMQQFGRIEYGVSPNKVIPDVQRPVAIDLVGNMFIHALNKDKFKVDDLDQLKVIVDWIKECNGDIPDINSNDKIAVSHAQTLKRLQKKYVNYLNNNDISSKKIITILKLGNEIGLWDYEFPERIVNNKKTVEISKQDELFFSLKGVLQDFCDLSIEVEKLIYLSPEEKAQELINTIRELGGLPKANKRKFKDGTDQGIYYGHLRDDANRINKKQEKQEQITNKEQQKLDWFNKIKEELSQFSIPSDAKAEELIKTIQELEWLPHLNERKFKDGTDQRKYYDHLQQAANKIVEKQEQITKEEQHKLYLFNKIKEELSQISISKEAAKVEELINTIRELGGLPPKANKRKFKDGTDQRSYYYNLQNDAKDIKEKAQEQITNEEQQKLDWYNKIKEELSQISISKEAAKVEELINTIRKLGRLPQKKDKIKFKDGTDQGIHYDNLLQKTKDIKEKQKKQEQITTAEQQKLNFFEEITRVLEYYPKSKKSNKEKIIDICNQYSIDLELNKSILNKSYFEVYVKIQFLINNGLNVVLNDGSVNEIIFMAEDNMKFKYNISIDELIDTYIVKNKRL